MRPLPNDWERALRRWLRDFDEFSPKFPVVYAGDSLSRRAHRVPIARARCPSRALVDLMLVALDGAQMPRANHGLCGHFSQRQTCPRPIVAQHCASVVDQSRAHFLPLSLLRRSCRAVVDAQESCADLTCARGHVDAHEHGRAVERPGDEADLAEVDTDHALTVAVGALGAGGVRGRHQMTRSIGKATDGMCHERLT